MAPISLEFIKDEREYKIKKTVFEHIPLFILQKLANLPIVGSQSLKKNVELL